MSKRRAQETGAGGGPLLALEQVSAGYEPGAEQLRGLDLDVRPGEVAAVISLDASGGKSTLVRVAAGLLPPAAGRVRFAGEDVYAMGYRADQRFRQRLGVVLEGGALLVNRTIRDNVALPLRYHGELRGKQLAARVDRLLAQTGYTEDPAAFPWQVSARGARLAAFARALARQPEMVIVDRFFEGLEMPDWKRLFELVLELNQGEGVSWLLVSETDPAIFQVAERVAVLEGGRLLAYGRRRELYAIAAVRAAFEAASEGLARKREESGRVLPVSSAELLASGLAGEEHTVTIDGLIERASPSRRRPEADSDSDVVVLMDDEGASGRRPRADDGPGEETVTIDGELLERARAEHAARARPAPGDERVISALYDEDEDGDQDGSRPRRDAEEEG